MSSTLSKSSAIQTDLSWLETPLARQNPAARLVAVDAGGTRTVAVCFHMAERALTAGVAGAANSDSVGARGAADAVASAIDEATGGERADVGVVALGGTDLRPATGWLESVLRGAVKELRVTDDVVAAWASVALGGPAIALVAGTGSHGFGVADGRAYFTGGWGHIFGDEGSGYWLGREAIRRALMACDGRGPDTLLVPLLAEETGSVQELVAALYAENTPKQKVAHYSKLVDLAAAQGDDVALELIGTGAAAIGGHLNALARADPELSLVPIGLVGGVWHSEAFWQAFQQTIPASDLRRLRRFGCPPVLGALALALRFADRTELCSRAIFDDLAATVSTEITKP